jgi:two-component system chemotaxis response regulator CheY
VLRSILSVMGVTQVIHVEDTVRAIELLSMEAFQAVFYDPRCEPYDGMPFPVAARRKETMLNPLLPIFALQERARRRDVEQARDAGVTDVVTAPISPKTIMTKMKAAPRPFILAQEFFGPDRRAKNRAPWSGGERRTRTARKQKVDFIHV